MMLSFPHLAAQHPAYHFSRAPEAVGKLAFRAPHQHIFLEASAGRISTCLDAADKSMLVRRLSQ